MADLITHTCVALIYKVATRGPRGGQPSGPATAQAVEVAGERWRLPPTVATFVLGTCLPDLIGRVPSMVLTTVRWSVPGIPEWLIYIWAPFHMPVGIVIASMAAAQAFRAGERRTAFIQLMGGGLLHMAVDVLQTHLGIGYLLLFPFSLWDYEAGLIGSEDTVRIVPILLPLTVLLCWLRWFRPRP